MTSHGRKDWLRTILYACFILAFSYVMYKSLRKLFAENTAVAQVKKSSPTLLYPSVTLCPCYTKDLLLSGTADDVNDKLSKLLVMISHTYEEGNR